MVESTLLNHKHPNYPDQGFIPGEGFERLIITGIERGLRMLSHLGATAPVAIAVTLTGVKGKIIGIDDWRYSFTQRPVLNEHLFLPEIVVSELSSPIEPLIRPIADMVWNACGVRQSIHFDSDGKWIKERR